MDRSWADVAAGACQRARAPQPSFPPNAQPTKRQCVEPPVQAPGPAAVATAVPAASTAAAAAPVQAAVAAPVHAAVAVPAAAAADVAPVGTHEAYGQTADDGLTRAMVIGILKQWYKKADFAELGITRDTTRGALMWMLWEHDNSKEAPDGEPTATTFSAAMAGALGVPKRVHRRWTGSAWTRERPEDPKRAAKREGKAYAKRHEYTEWQRHRRAKAQVQGEEYDILTMSNDTSLPDGYADWTAVYTRDKSKDKPPPHTQTHRERRGEINMLDSTVLAHRIRNWNGDTDDLERMTRTFDYAENLRQHAGKNRGISKTTGRVTAASPTLA